MTFEQPAGLNRSVTEPMPLTWSSRWKFIRIFLPLLVFITICSLEILIVKMWMMGEVKFSFLWLALLPSGFLLIVLLILGEIRLRDSQGNRDQLLNVLDNGISFYPNKRPLIRWPKVVAFWFEDIPGKSQLSKVTIEYFGERRTKFPRRAALALDKKNQCPALLSELQLFQQQHNLKFGIELDRALPARRPLRNPVWGMSLFLAGFFFLMHGAPLILAPLSHQDGKPHQSESGDEWSPKQQKKVAKFLQSHFPTRAEFDHFTLEIGCVLSAIGVGLMVLGNVVQKQRVDKQPPDNSPKM